MAGQDFIPNLESNGGRGRPTVNHILTLDMAKELSMIQRTEKGKQRFPPPGTYALTSGDDFTGISPIFLTCGFEVNLEKVRGMFRELGS